LEYGLPFSGFLRGNIGLEMCRVSACGTLCPSNHGRLVGWFRFWSPVISFWGTKYYLL